MKRYQIHHSLIFIGSLSLVLALFQVDWLITTLGGWGSFACSWGTLSSGIFLSSLREGSLYAPSHGTRKTSLLTRIFWALILLVFYLSVYFSPELIRGWVILVNPLIELISGDQADQWSLYSTLYTVAVMAFGVRALKRHRHTRYHLLRTCSLIFFQLSFAFLIPGLLKLAQLPDFYFTYFWPLKPEYLLPFDYIMHPQTGVIGAEVSGFAVGRAMLLWGAFMSLIATPLLTYYFGKRWYCSWVCGCGALAETLGDEWRHLTPKSRESWVWERYLIHGSLGVIIAITILLWVNEAMGRSLLGEDGSSWFWGGYGLFISMIFSGVIGVGFYPLLGPRVWCRFGCPQAAILGLLQKWWSRFQIRTNGGQCISCGRCSASCEMGIDVRAYAQEGEVIIRASCVGCGVCASVCPRGVLRLENSPLRATSPRDEIV